MVGVGKGSTDRETAVPALQGCGGLRRAVEDEKRDKMAMGI